MDIIDFEEKKKKRDFPEVKEGECPIQERPWYEKKDLPHGKCTHWRVWLDEEKLELECRDCGEKINPVWYIGELMKHENRLWRRYSEIRQMSEKLSKKLGIQNRVKCKHCGKLTPIHEDVIFEEHSNEKK